MSYDDDNHGHDDGGLTPAQREFAGALRGLRPAAPAGISRDRLLFEAGAAAARRSAKASVFRWRAAAAVLLVGNATLMAAALRSQPTSAGGTSVAQAPPVASVQALTVVMRPDIVVARADAPLPLGDTPWGGRWAGLRLIGVPPTASRDDGYLAIRDAVLRQGISALPAPAVHVQGRETRPLDVEELLGT